MKLLKVISPLLVVGLIIGNLAMATGGTVSAGDLSLVSETVNPAVASVEFQHHHHGHHGHHGYHGHHGHHGFHGHYGHHGFHGHHGHHGHHYHFFGGTASAPAELPQPTVALN